MTDKKKILIVDDGEDYASVLKDRLEFEGYIAETVSDGQKALTQIDLFKPDVVLLDVMMPVMDGFAVAKELKHRGTAASIIFVTAFGREPNEEQKRIIGDSSFINKPFEMDELLEAIRKKSS